MHLIFLVCESEQLNPRQVVDRSYICMKRFNFFKCKIKKICKTSVAKSKRFIVTSQFHKESSKYNTNQIVFSAKRKGFTLIEERSSTGKLLCILSWRQTIIQHTVNTPPRNVLFIFSSIQIRSSFPPWTALRTFSDD